MLYDPIFTPVLEAVMVPKETYDLIYGYTCTHAGHQTYIPDAKFVNYKESVACLERFLNDEIETLDGRKCSPELISLATQKFVHESPDLWKTGPVYHNRILKYMESAYRVPEHVKDVYEHLIMEHPEHSDAIKYGVNKYLEAYMARVTQEMNFLESYLSGDAVIPLQEAVDLNFEGTYMPEGLGSTVAQLPGMIIMLMKRLLNKLNFALVEAGRSFSNRILSNNQINEEAIKQIYQVYQAKSATRNQQPILYPDPKVINDLRQQYAAGFSTFRDQMIKAIDDGNFRGVDTGCIPIIQRFQIVKANMSLPPNSSFQMFRTAILSIANNIILMSEFMQCLTDIDDELSRKFGEDPTNIKKQIGVNVELSKDTMTNRQVARSNRGVSTNASVEDDISGLFVMNENETEPPAQGKKDDNPETKSDNPQTGDASAGSAANKEKDDSTEGSMDVMVIDVDGKPYKEDGEHITTRGVCKYKTHPDGTFILVGGKKVLKDFSTIQKTGNFFLDMISFVTFCTTYISNMLKESGLDEMMVNIDHILGWAENAEKTANRVANVAEYGRKTISRLKQTARNSGDRVEYNSADDYFDEAPNISDGHIIGVNPQPAAQANSQQSAAPAQTQQPQNPQLLGPDGQPISSTPPKETDEMEGLNKLLSFLPINVESVKDGFRSFVNNRINDAKGLSESAKHLVKEATIDNLAVKIFDGIGWAMFPNDFRATPEAESALKEAAGNKPKTDDANTSSDNPKETKESYSETDQFGYYYDEGFGKSIQNGTQAAGNGVKNFGRNVEAKVVAGFAMKVFSELKKGKAGIGIRAAKLFGAAYTVGNINKSITEFYKIYKLSKENYPEALRQYKNEKEKYISLIKVLINCAIVSCATYVVQTILSNGKEDDFNRSVISLKNKSLPAPKAARINMAASSAAVNASVPQGIINLQAKAPENIKNLWTFINGWLYGGMPIKGTKEKTVGIADIIDQEILSLAPIVNMRDVVKVDLSSSIQAGRPQQ